MAFPETDLGKPFDEITPVRIFSDFAQHGNAWATHRCRFIRSEYKQGDVLPATFHVQDIDGNVLQTFEDACPRYHGFAIADGYEMAGCGSANEGGGHITALKYRSDLDRHVLTRIDYPDADQRTGSLYSAAALNFAIGNYGNGVVRVTPSKGTIDAASDVMEWPAGAWPEGTARRSPCAWQLQRGGHFHLVAILPDGYLYLYYSEDFEAVPLRIDLFPELRMNLTRADYSCSGPMAVKLEVGARYGFVYRSAQDATHLTKIDLDEGTISGVVALPDSVHGKVGDMAVIIPALPSDTADPADCVTSLGTTADPSKVAGSSGNGDDDNNGTVIALAISFAVVVLAMLVLIAFFVRRRDAVQMDTLKKHVFENPNFGGGEQGVLPQ